MNQYIEFLYEPHSFTKRKFLPWQFCTNCGLISLGNDYTKWAINKGCNYKEHSQADYVKTKFTTLEKYYESRK